MQQINTLQCSKGFLYIFAMQQVFTLQCSNRISLKITTKLRRRTLLQNTNFEAEESFLNRPISVFLTKKYDVPYNYALFSGEVALAAVGCIPISFTFFAMNKRTVGDIARETNVLWEEEPCSTCRKEEIGQTQPQLYGTSYFFVKITPLGQKACLLLFLHRYNRERAILLK